MQGGGGEGSASGSMSTVSREDNLVLSSEDSSCPDESELELGLGLSLGGGFKVQQASNAAQQARILTSMDIRSYSSSSSSSSSSLTRANVTSGVKRTADSVAANGSK
ncbi:hypothetical protein SLEP1_g14268 [Rubroshorea leprosula]|nr:hypothetical protein SLEP1_g14268 [Rubroshorea leprosula]